MSETLVRFCLSVCRVLSVYFVWNESTSCKLTIKCSFLSCRFVPMCWNHHRACDFAKNLTNCENFDASHFEDMGAIDDVAQAKILTSIFTQTLSLEALITSSSNISSSVVLWNFQRSNGWNYSNYSRWNKMPTLLLQTCQQCWTKFWSRKNPDWENCDKIVV